jgi:hypothetical protein
MKVFYKMMALGLLTTVFVLVFSSSCDDPYRTVDYSKFIAEEAELRKEYIDRVFKDSLFASLVDTVDKRSTEGWLSFQIEKGSPIDSVLPGTPVSFKYKYYYVMRDADDNPVLVLKYTNRDDESLASYTVGALTSSDSEVYKGVDNAIHYMSLYGKSFVIMAHSLADNQYYPVVAEIEITWMNLD